jgi:hypothetical protein
MKIERWTMQHQKTFDGKVRKHYMYDIDLLPRVTIHQGLRYDEKIELTINFHWIVWQYQIFFLRSE